MQTYAVTVVEPKRPHNPRATATYYSSADTKEQAIENAMRAARREIPGCIMRSAKRAGGA